jgi:hypothetical protein
MMGRYFWKAWLLAGMLDIIYAGVLSVWFGGTVGSMLLSVASGPFGNGVADSGIAGQAAGFCVHFAIMAVMVAVYGVLAQRPPLSTMSPWLAGALYGLALYGVMYWIVLPLRFPTVHPITEPARVARALFPHIALVGWPIALIARRVFGPRPA